MSYIAAANDNPLPKLGIIAGSSELPRHLIRACTRQGREYFVIAIEGTTDQAVVENVPHEWVRIGSLGKAISVMKQHGVEELVMAGRVKRPQLADLRPDLKATKLLARLGSNLFRGDDELLRAIIRFFEEEGFRVVGVDQIVRDILTTEGPVGTKMPDARSETEITLGIRIAKGIGALDIGQAVVVYHNQVLGVEAAEGTDALITRCAALKPEGAGGVLVKVKKPQQESRIDLPTMGINTVEAVAKAGFSGIALEAGCSLMLDRDAIAQKADELGIFVVGFTHTD
jgi:DUF1009 family protein